MITKLRIDLINKVLEVEGEQSFVERIYDEFRTGIASKDVPRKTKKRASKRTQKKTSNGTSNKRKPPKGSLKILGELSLMGGDKGPSLKDFFDRYKVKSHFDKMTLCAYYLKHVEGVDAITANHVYTCYKNLKLTQPRFFAQALTDTKNQKAFIDISDDGVISLTTQGLNHVKHELDQSVKTD